MFIIVALITLFIIHLSWPVFFAGAPYVATSVKNIRAALNLAALRPGETLLDLGCGHGRVLRVAAREFGAVARGIEIDPLRVVWARLLNRWVKLGQITVVWGNMYTISYTADVVFLFGCEIVAVQLSSRLKTQLSPGSRVVSYGFALPGWTPDQVQGQCYLYQVTGSQKGEQ